MSRFRNRKRWLLPLALGAAGWLAVCFVPFPDESLHAFPSATVVLDRAGEPLRVFLGPGDLDCRPGYQPREDDWITRAMVAAEDQRFYSHHGLDPLALLRATAQNLFHGRRISGASTLSTQVIRLLEARPRTFWTKLYEAFRALQLERRLTKTEILGQYLDRAPFGGNLIGIESASRRYFGKSAHDLTLAEAAMLAGLPQAPSRLRPDRHPARARARQRYVLDRMLALDLIDGAQHRAALDLRVAVQTHPYPMRAPHFAGVLGDTPGRTVRTTLDPVWQQRAESTLARQVDALRDRGVRGGAVVVIEVASGAVRAWAGSPDFRDAWAGQVDGTRARRSAGSTLKPFVYALAMDQGWITPATILADVPRSYTDVDPENFDRSFLGRVTARDALILSLNIPVLDLTARMGVPEVHRTLRALGLTTLDRASAHYGTGIALGHGEVRLLDLANAYAALARGGRWQAVRMTEDEPGSAGRAVFTPAAAWLVSDMLGGAERAMEATSHRADARMPRVAWKTGTSSGTRDAWTIAYNPEWVVGVWIGNPDGSGSTALIGKEAAAPVAWSLFREQYPGGDAPWFDRPAEVVRRPVCAESGAAPGPHCPGGQEDWYIAGITPHRLCEPHRESGVAQWSPEIAAFLARQQDMGPAPADVSILAPAQDAVFRKVEGWGEDRQRIALRASGAKPVYWFINGAYVGRSEAGGAFPWPMERGEVQIACSDTDGRSASTRIRVE